MSLLRALHLVFMVTWFAGLFYLPRLFVYHAMSEDETTRRTLVTMQGKLMRLTHIGALLTAVFGILMLWEMPVWLMHDWMRIKLALVALLIGYHVWCLLLVRRFARGEVPHGHVWFRWFNEVPTLLLIGIILLAVLKPF